MAGPAPLVDLFGVYFPGWLVSSVVGLMLAYGVVRILGQRPSTRELGESGLFFCSLTVSTALVLWLALWSRY
jgi:hypothetical protein